MKPVPPVPNEDIKWFLSTAWKHGLGLRPGAADAFSERVAIKMEGIPDALAERIRVEAFNEALEAFSKSGIRARHARQ